MDFLHILKEATLGSANSMWSIIKIVIPIMILVEVIKEIKLLDKICNFFRPITKLLGLSDYTVFPLLSGLFFGLVYGAGLIIDAAEEGNITKKDMYLVISFLGACHAIVEDTLIFVQIGANGWVVFLSRLIVAFILTYILHLVFDKSPSAQRLINEEVSG